MGCPLVISKLQGFLEVGNSIAFTDLPFVAIRTHWLVIAPFASIVGGVQKLFAVFLVV